VFDKFISFHYIAHARPYMISHFAGNPQGPSLSFSFFSWGPDVAGVAVVAAGAAAPFDVEVCVVSVTAAAFFSSPF
jgi:hypothetical protein